MAFVMGRKVRRFAVRSPFGSRGTIGLGLAVLVAVSTGGSPPPPIAHPASKPQSAQASVGVLPDPPPRPHRHSRKKKAAAAESAPSSPPPSPPVVRRAIPPFVEMGGLTSQPGEDKEQFLVRLAQTMDLFTRNTGHEACGLILQSDTDNTFRVRLTSNRAHISCTMMSFREPGFHAIGEDIHSHPRIVGGVASNGPDTRSRSDLRCGGRIIIYDESFSDVDFHNGPGYLVSRGRLLFQHGAKWPMRQVAVLGRIDKGQVLQVSGADAIRKEALAAAAWSNQDVEGLPSTQCPQENPVKPVDANSPVVNEQSTIPLPSPAPTAR